MYNLYIYEVNRTILYTQLSHKDCIVNLVKHNVKTGFKLANVITHMHKRVNQLRLSELS